MEKDDVEPAARQEGSSGHLRETLDRSGAVSSVGMVLTAALGLASLICLAVRLWTTGKLSFLNSDTLTPQVFFDDLFSGHGVASYSIGSASFFVPDYLLYGIFFLTTGASALPVYFVFSYVLLAGLVGLCIKNISNVRHGLFTGLAFANFYLVLQFLPGHAAYVWILGIPAGHGGAMLLGFAMLFVSGRLLQAGRRHGLLIALFVIVLAGFLSDALFFLQSYLPVCAALWFLARGAEDRRRILRWHLWAGAAAIAGCLAFRWACSLLGWFYFARVVRLPVSSSQVWRSTVQFGLDTWDVFLRQGWAFVALAALVFVGFAFGAHRRRSGASASPTPDPEDADRHRVIEFYRAFCLTSLLIILPFLLLMGSWKDEFNARRLVNWMMLPLFSLTVSATARWTRAGRSGESPGVTSGGFGWSTAAISLTYGACAFLLEPTVSRRSFSLPYPEDVAMLDDFLDRHRLRRGLAEYWNVTYLNVLSHGSVQLRQIKPSGEPYFWNNPALSYYARDLAGPYTWPDYEFLLADRLDEAALAAAFGEPLERHTVARFVVLILSASNRDRLRARLEPAVRAKLSGHADPSNLPVSR